MAWCCVRAARVAPPATPTKDWKQGETNTKYYTEIHYIKRTNYDYIETDQSRELLTTQLMFAPYIPYDPERGDEFFFCFWSPYKRQKYIV